MQRHALWVAPLTGAGDAALRGGAAEMA